MTCSVKWIETYILSEKIIKFDGKSSSSIQSKMNRFRFEYSTDGCKLHLITESEYIAISKSMSDAFILIKFYGIQSQPDFNVARMNLEIR